MTGTHLAPVFPPFSFVVSLRSRRVWHASWYLAFRTTRRFFLGDIEVQSRLISWRGHLVLSTGVGIV